MTLYQLTHGRVTWTNIINPNAKDIAALREQYPYIHPLHLEDVQSRIERPKIDTDDDYLFVVMHFPKWDPVARITRAAEVDFFVGRGYVVTLHDGQLKPLNKLFEVAEEDEQMRQRLLGKGANHTFYVIIDTLVDYIFPILRRVDANIQAIEEQIFTERSQRIIQEISIVRRDVLALRRIVRQQLPVIEEIETGEHAIIHEDLEEYFGDIADHLRKARDILDENYEVIAGLAETADTLLNHRINDVMRILTVISFIMLPLTLISSIYGMNIELPLDDHPMAFFIISLFMLIIAVAMLLYFRRRGWL
ncbi:MAG: magnesium and cobalt transport protein CorA [Chloroflexi bacterium]|nr:MAG: magnesium and cobalt transport protein CorA [Chloroflexota bacterium]